MKPGEEDNGITESFLMKEEEKEEKEDYDRPIEERKNQTSERVLIENVISAQTAEGSWNDLELIELLFGK